VIPLPIKGHLGGASPILGQALIRLDLPLTLALKNHKLKNHKPSNGPRPFFPAKERQGLGTLSDKPRVQDPLTRIPVQGQNLVGLYPHRVMTENPAARSNQDESSLGSGTNSGHASGDTIQVNFAR
jgi:hypothetical protein